jgi:hypothetical protein
MSRGQGNEKMKRTEMSNLDTPNLEKNFSKSFEKPLDKSLTMWYNINVKRRREFEAKDLRV